MLSIISLLCDHRGYQFWIKQTSAVVAADCLSSDDHLSPPPSSPHTGFGYWRWWWGGGYVSQDLCIILSHFRNCNPIDTVSHLTCINNISQTIFRWLDNYREIVEMQICQNILYPSSLRPLDHNLRNGNGCYIPS